MLIAVEARTAQGDLLALPLSDNSSGFTIEDIDGLDPVNATLVSSSFANLAGEQFQAARREKRNIVIKLSLNADYIQQSIRQLRNSLYNFFMPQSEVFLRFIMDDDDPVNISGRIESFVSPLFAQDPEATISVICFDPDFAAGTSTVTSGSTANDSSETLIQYPGTIETGFELTMNLTRNISGFVIYNRAFDNTTRFLEYDGLLQTGDSLLISTVNGNKAALLTRGGVESSSLYAISPYSDWIQLFPGDNNFRVYTEGAAIPFFLEYTTKFGGL